MLPVSAPQIRMVNDDKIARERKRERKEAPFGLRERRHRRWRSIKPHHHLGRNEFQCCCFSIRKTSSSHSLILSNSFLHPPRQLSTRAAASWWSAKKVEVVVWGRRAEREEEEDDETKIISVPSSLILHPHLHPYHYNSRGVPHHIFTSRGGNWKQEDKISFRLPHDDVQILKKNNEG